MRNSSYYCLTLPSNITILLVFSFSLLLAACSTVHPDISVTGTELPVKVTRTPGTVRPLSTPSRTAPTATTPLKVNLTDEELRGTVIHFWHAWTGAGGKTVRQLVDEFNLNNRWGILVVPIEHSSYDAIEDSLAISVALKDPPDLVTAYLHQDLSWNLDGGPVELDLYVNDPDWGMKAAEQSDFYSVFWQQDVLDEKRLGIPAQRSAQLLYYNLSWAQELGFEKAPKDPGSFTSQACASVKALRTDTDSSNDNLGGWIIAQGDRPDYSAMLAWITSYGGKIYQAPANPTALRSPYHFSTSPVEEAFTSLRELYDEGCSRFATVSYPEAEFAARGALFSTGSLLGISAQKTALNQVQSRDQWTVIPFPASGTQPVIGVYGPSFQILHSSLEEQLAAWVFIKWMISPENQVRMIQTTGAFPLQKTALDQLGTYRQLNPQWAAAVDLLSSAYPEPVLPSWGTVRWALSDASTQLFRSYFTIDQVPSLLALLDRTAAELYLGPDLDEVFATTEPENLTPTP